MVSLYIAPLRREAQARIAQLVEQRIENPRVAGSIPAPGTISFLETSQPTGRANSSIYPALMRMTARSVSRYSDGSSAKLNSGSIFGSDASDNFFIHSPVHKLVENGLIYVVA